MPTSNIPTEVLEAKDEKENYSNFSNNASGKELGKMSKSMSKKLGSNNEEMSWAP